ncbi:MAG TPA: hypothetical protein VFB60_21445 [Ktedonobacteraceae bacterium]|nr:hypothetical protein [Ktedonobacteraceae bacterium]
MKINSTAVLTGCGALISLGLAPIFVGYAISQPPEWVKDNPNIVWIIAAFLVGLGVWLAVVSTKSVEKNQSDPSELGATIAEITDILDELTIYPGPSIPPDLDGILSSSKTDADTLIKTYSGEKKKRGRVAKEMRDQCIANLLKLIIATAIYFSLQGRQGDLIEIASSTHNICRARRSWSDAAEMAYFVAKAYNERAENRECQIWMYKLEKYVKLASKDAECRELKAMLYDMQGLVMLNLKKKEGEAQDLFNQALGITRDLSLRSRITFHLAEVEYMKIGGNKDDAIQKYKTVLGETGDILLKIECYDRLGRIAFSKGDFTAACSYHEDQCRLAAERNQLS